MSFGRQLFLTSADPYVQQRLGLSSEDISVEIKTKAIFGTPVVVGGSWAVRSAVTIAALRELEQLFDTGLLLVCQRDDLSSFIDYVEEAQPRLTISEDLARAGAVFLDGHPGAIRRFHAPDMSSVHFRNIAVATIRDKVNGRLRADWKQVARFVDALFASRRTDRDALLEIAARMLGDSESVRRYIECSYFILGAAAADSVPLFQSDWVRPSDARMAGPRSSVEDNPTAIDLMEGHDLLDYEMKAPLGEGEPRFSDSVFLSLLEFQGLDAVVSKLSAEAVCRIGAGPEAAAVRRKLATLFGGLMGAELPEDADVVRDAIGMPVWREFEGRVRDAAKDERQARSAVGGAIGRLRTAGLAGGTVGAVLTLAGNSVPVVGICTFVVSLGTFVLSRFADRQLHPIYTFVSTVRQSSED